MALVAFHPTWLARLSDVDPARHPHGIVATAWLVMLTAQAFLMRDRRVALQRRPGRIAAYALAPLFVVSGLLVTRSMAAATRGFGAAFGTRLAWVDLLATALFAVAVAMAVRDRRRVQPHARWMACTALLLLAPALARLAPLVPGVHSFAAAFHAGFLATKLVVLALLVDDHRSGQRLAPYRVLLLVALARHLGLALVDRMPMWASIVHALAPPAG